MALFKEIVTKAVVGKGKKNIKNDYSLLPDIIPTTVLGCWVINHKFKGYKVNNEIHVDGSFDVNIWYSHDNNSKTTVVNKNYTYNSIFDIKTKEDIDLDNSEIIVRCLKQPTCLDVKIDNNKINLEIETELGVEIVGEEKVKIQIQEQEDLWDDLDKVEEDIDKVNEKFL